MGADKQLVTVSIATQAKMVRKMSHKNAGESSSLPCILHIQRVLFLSQHTVGKRGPKRKDKLHIISMTLYTPIWPPESS